MQWTSLGVLLGALMALAGCQSPQQVAAPTPAPGTKYDLSQWKLTLPDRDANEILPAQLASYSSEYFHLTADGAMAFVAPAGGGTTENSRYPRSELREVLDPGDDNVNWSGSGHHALSATCQVIQAPREQKIIVGQIHGFDARPLIKLQWEKGKLKALIKQSPKGSNDDISHVFATRVDNRPFSYRIEVNEGRLSVEVEGERIEHDFYREDPAWREVTYYFKAGAYAQTAKSANGEVAEVHFTRLQVEHGQ
ncbi:polysaccharide lyase family 7 protein [Pseudomonas sp. UL073]|uniref:Polysaccharide lyase family 7 protein n=1 Tax=Zestomonas insulae TaxID=2809017 RepID=A0ABS2IEE8_9GAMM|nr:polysaccharide lyase family 7 protein [Pseudomonas insulae]MBM7060260.1 polysaccharide lyase family 7 protein [Pseudomonas insulae]